MPLAPTAVELVVIGAGGHGAETIAYLRRLGAKVRLLGAIDDGRTEMPGGARHLGGIDRLLELAARRKRVLHYITAVGDNATRMKIVARIEAARIARLKPWTLVHPDARAGTLDVLIGEGSCLAPAAIVTTRARIGRHCILNVKASVSHDCIVGDYCNLNPGATICGGVTLGEGCYIGAGATIVPGATIGAWTTVGAGAVVVGDLPGGVTAVGVPARAR